jgi:AraC-like DNA-binding protein
MQRRDFMEHLSAILKLGGAGEFRLSIGEAARLRCEPGWELGPNWAPRLADFDLWFVWAGTGRMTTATQTIDLRPGVCVWMRPGGRYEAQHDAKNPLGVNFVHFDLVKVGANARSRKLARTKVAKPAFEVMETRHLEFVDVTMRKIIELAALGSPSARASAARLHAALLSELMREQAEATTNELSGLERYHWEVMQRVAERIRESPSQVGSVAALAKEAGYSVDHFSRVFAAVHGSRPHAYVIGAKMARARHLLGQSALSIGQVAEVLGFENRHFFSRQFLQHHGCTPTEYRERLDKAG